RASRGWTWGISSPRSRSTSSRRCRGMMISGSIAHQLAEPLDGGGGGFLDDCFEQLNLLSIVEVEVVPLLGPLVPQLLPQVDAGDLLDKGVHYGFANFLGVHGQGSVVEVNQTCYLNPIR